MPDPAFQPLTMTQDEWYWIVTDIACRRGSATLLANKLREEVLAHARAGEALRRERDDFKADYVALSQAVIAGDFQYTLQLVELQRRRSEAKT